MIMMSLDVDPNTYREVSNVVQDSLDVNDPHSKPDPKSCRMVTLSCWLAFLTFSVVIVQSAISLIKDLTRNEDFWQSAKHFMQLYNRSYVGIANVQDEPLNEK